METQKTSLGDLKPLSGSIRVLGSSIIAPFSVYFPGPSGRRPRRLEPGFAHLPSFNVASHRFAVSVPIITHPRDVSNVAAERRVRIKGNCLALY